MPIGLGARRRAVTLEEGAGPNAARCPACGEPLFVWLETSGYGPREDQIVDRCENCGLAVVREAVPDPERAVEELVGGHPAGNGQVGFRAPNAASLQAWFGAENWAALEPGDRTVKPTPKAARLLLRRRGLEPRRIRHL